MGAVLGGENGPEYKQYEDKLLELMSKGYRYERITNIDGSVTHNFFDPSGKQLATVTDADLLNGLKFLHGKVKTINI